MTTVSTPTEARALVEENAEQIEQFIKSLTDNGIAVQLMEAVNRDFFGSNAQINPSDEVTRSPIELVRTAINDVADINGFTGTVSFSVTTLLAGAASLEFLVRHARNINPLVLPAETIPSDEVVRAALVVFHELRK